MEQDWRREHSRALREKLDKRLEQADALRREWNGSRSGERTGELGEEPETLKPTDPERQ